VEPALRAGFRVRVNPPARPACHSLRRVERRLHLPSDRSWARFDSSASFQWRNVGPRAARLHRGTDSLSGAGAPSPRYFPALPEEGFALQRFSVQKYRRLAHVLPFSRRPLVFLTAVADQRRPLLAAHAVFDCLTEIWRRSAEMDGWYVGDYLLMPDHVHLFAKGVLGAKSLAAWVGSWKSISSRRLNGQAGISPPLWQPDYFDRFLRSDESYRSKWDYVALNPVRKGLCQRPDQWPWKGRLFEIDI
jgi:putative transposase